MGVQGLHTYILQQTGCLRRHRLRNCQLVVDASNLAHHLYHLHRIDFIFAGEYEQYARELRRAFTCLTECAIEPLFVLDGAKDWSGPKFREQRSRLERRVRKCAQLKRSGLAGEDDGGNNRLLPVWALEIFIAIVTHEFNFQLIVSPTGDADQHLASLAGQLGCPILTNDSDFLIFDLPGGVVLTNTLHLTRALVDHQEGGDQPFLDCEIYFVRQFYLSSLRQPANPAMLPLCATLIGNDYLSKGAVGRCILSRVQLPKGGKKGLNPRHKTIAGMLAWTHRNFAHPEDCLAALRRLLLGSETIDDEEEEDGGGGGGGQKKAWAHKFLAAVEDSMRLYQISGSLQLVDAPDGTGCRCRLKFAASLGVAHWLTDSGLLEGRHSLLFLDVAQHGKLFLPIGLEDVAEASAFSHTADLRLQAYVIQLKAFGVPHQFESIVEHHRHLGALGKTVYQMPPSIQLSPTRSFLEAALASLGYPQDPLKGSVLDGGLRLLLYVALASRRLLLGSESGSAVAPKTAGAVCLALLALCLHKFSGRLLFLEAEGDAAEAAVEAEYQLARRRVLAKYSERAVINNRVKYDLHIVHCISHFQATLLSTSLLLQAHRNYCRRISPTLQATADDDDLPALPHVSEFLSGRVVYNLASDVESRKDGVLFLSELLVRRSGLASVFNTAACLILL